LFSIENDEKQQSFRRTAGMRKSVSLLRFVRNGKAFFRLLESTERKKNNGHTRNRVQIQSSKTQVESAFEQIFSQKILKNLLQNPMGCCILVKLSV